MLSRYFHSEIRDNQSSLYSCILIKGVRLANVIEYLWDVDTTDDASNQKGMIRELYDDPLLQSIANLKNNLSIRIDTGLLKK